MDMTHSTTLLSERYRLGEPLGRGGVAGVFLGHDLLLDRPVAVKVLHAHLARDGSFVARFRREAQYGASLNHPAIVGVYDTGDIPGDPIPLPYLVLEYVEGHTLRDLVARDGPLPVQRALDITADLCMALAFAHGHGIVHCDVTPGNVMLSRDGVVKVMDFGIACTPTTAASPMTLPDTVIGTAQYLAPEQARGKPVDGRTDVYATGCVLYELLTGWPPFTGNSPFAIMQRHVGEPPEPPSTLRPEISPGLDAVVLKALAKGPDNRYASAAEFHDDLVRVLVDETPHAPKLLPAPAPPPTARARRPRRAWSAALLPVVLIAALSALWVTDRFSVDEPAAAIPRLAGLEYAEAVSAVKAAGFAHIRRRLVPCWTTKLGTPPPCTARQAGTVLSSEPRAGVRAVASTTITLSVGQAPAAFPMPDVVGGRLTDVRAVLSARHLLLDPAVDYVPNDDPAQSGMVAAQDPPAGARVAAGRIVRLRVYGAPRMVRIIDYTGQPDEVAEAGLTALGFRILVRHVDSEGPTGQVVSQTPDHGLVPEGSEVVLDVSTGGLMAMPSTLIGRSEQEASTMLAEAGHRGEITVVRRAVFTSAEDATVIDTDPAAGETLRKSDPVTLLVGEYISETSTSPQPTPEPTAEPLWPPQPARARD